MNARGTLPLFDTQEAEQLSHKSLIHGLQQLVSQTTLLMAVLSQREQCAGNELQHRQDSSEPHCCYVSDPGPLPAKPSQQPNRDLEHRHDRELCVDLKEQSIRTGTGDSTSRNSITWDHIQLPGQPIERRQPARKVCPSSVPSKSASTPIASHGKETDTQADADHSQELPPQMQLMRQFASNHSLSEDLRSRVRQLYRAHAPPTCVTQQQDSLQHHHCSHGELQQASYAVNESSRADLVDRIGDDLWED
jgi:hypothetical protein